MTVTDHRPAQEAVAARRVEWPAGHRPRPNADWTLAALRGPIAQALRVPGGELALEALGAGSLCDDGPLAFAVRDRSGPRAALMCSSPAFPDMVGRSMSRAARAKRELAAPQGEAILAPLLEGSLDGASFALLPYCQALSSRRGLRWVERQLLQPRVLHWLLSVARTTVADADEATLQRCFDAPLRHLASLDGVGPDLQDAARRAGARLHEGSWRPRSVLMHGDFWAGNILIDAGPSGRRVWSDRFVVIDWPGSELRGYAFYDLVRYALSAGIGERVRRHEVLRHCEVLGCRPDDAMAYLLCALGHIALHLERFPFERFVSLAEACCGSLRRIDLH